MWIALCCPLFLFYGGVSISTEALINDEIVAKEVRLVSPTGEQLGIMSSKEALDIAVKQNLDLVMIAPKAAPPVCKIMDYGKYCFEQQKRDKEAKKNQKNITIKEIQLSVTIEQHDMMVKAKRTIEFLKNGDKVKVTIRFIRRQLAHTELGVEVMETFYEMVKDYANIERKPKVEGRNAIMILSPKEKS